MAFREVPVFEVREVLRLWLRGERLRAVEPLVNATVALTGRVGAQDPAARY